MLIRIASANVRRRCRCRCWCPIDRRLHCSDRSSSSSCNGSSSATSSQLSVLGNNIGRTINRQVCSNDRRLTRIHLARFVCTFCFRSHDVFVAVSRFSVNDTCLSITFLRHTYVHTIRTRTRFVPVRYHSFLWFRVNSSEAASRGELAKHSCELAS